MLRISEVVIMNSKQFKLFFIIGLLILIFQNFDDLGDGTEVKKNFEVDWKDINWDKIQDMQDRALSFDFSDDIADFPLTDDMQKCRQCSFNQICAEIEIGADLLSHST